MFEREEGVLAEMNKQYHEVQIPIEQIDTAIMGGLNRAKKEAKVRKKRKHILFPIVAAAILLMSFFTSIRISPTFADFVSVLPGMENVVDLIRNDKGLLAAVENDYLQEINQSQEKNGINVTINSVIADEKGMVLFYTIDTTKAHELLDIKEPTIRSLNGSPISLASLSFGSPEINEGSNKLSGNLEFFFQDAINASKFEIDLKVKKNNQIETFSIPFELKKPLKQMKSYQVDETVTVEGQRITIKEITVYPLRIAIHLVMDPTNSKKLLEFQDIRLIDENGETWTKIQNGSTASHISALEKILYLQSNYFREPKELYVAFNKIQAVDKDEAYVLVDMEKQVIIKQPKGEKLSDFKVNNKEFTFILETTGYNTDNSNGFNYFIFSDITDSTGKIMDHNSYMTTTDEGKQQMGVTFGNDVLATFKNPIRLELFFYPSWIEKEVKVKIK
ncbi:DUF4179 domain-containing protein [Peribacillus alkalitolerans]|uniref:DUF4179 domain-containing protein n=1 Tax=Peribacillus alkalitolerans TaxID=1550385 RepID=UPI0013CF8559|nr:DUF4179 domain-containing protein [Peribacillus alkalitolerans]